MDTSKEENTPIKVNSNIVEVMKLSRHDRRRIAKLNGVKNIPSIKNVEIRKLTPEEINENQKSVSSDVQAVQETPTVQS